jgi:YD repeat-containing protein
MVDALLRPTQYVYDGAGNVIRTIEYGGAIVPLASYSLSYVRSEITRLNLATHAETRVTRQVYDGANRAVFAIDAVGQVTAFAYDANGNATKSTRYLTLYVGSTDPTASAMASWATASGGATRVTRTLFDGAGRPVFTVDGAGYVMERQYNGAGQLTSETRYATT